LSSRSIGPPKRDRSRRAFRPPAVPLRGVALLSAVLAAVTLAVGHASAADHDPPIVVERVVGGLDQAVAFTFSPDGRIWYVEKAEANVRIYDPATGETELFVHVPGVRAEVEQGLVGIALDPRYPARPHVYLYATRQVQGDLRDQLLRVTDSAGRGTGLRSLWEAPASEAGQHSGGRLLFGPTGDLFMTVGDALDPRAAQDPSSDRGKILRLARPVGSGGSAARVYATGIRNSYGLAFDPESGGLWETENGPTCNDEINLIREGGNYGWGPSGSCDDGVEPTSTNADGGDPILPLLTFTPPIAPTGTAFCDGCGLGRTSEGAMFFADYNNGEIHRVTLDRSREGVADERVVARTPDLALSMEVGPDQALYVSSYISIFRLVLRGGQAAPSATPSSDPPSAASPSPSPSGTGSADGNGVAGAALLVVLAAMAAIGIGIVVSIILRRR